VGRNFMYHDCQAVLAISKDPNPTVFQKTLGVNDFYFRGPDLDYPMGNIQMIGKSQAAMFRGEKPLETMFAPNWALRDVAEHAVDFWLSPRTCRSPATGSPSARMAPSTWRTRRATPPPPSGCTLRSTRCPARSACSPATWLTGSVT